MTTTPARNVISIECLNVAITDDATLDTPRGAEPWGKRFVGNGGVREGLAARLAGIPDVHFGEDQYWVSGDRGTSEGLLTGTMTAGERIAVRGCDLWQFRDGPAIRKDAYWKIVDQ